MQDKQTRGFLGGLTGLKVKKRDETLPSTCADTRTSAHKHAQRTYDLCGRCSSRHNNLFNLQAWLDSHCHKSQDRGQDHAWICRCRKTFEDGSAISVDVVEGIINWKRVLVRPGPSRVIIPRFIAGTIQIVQTILF